MKNKLQKITPLLIVILGFFTLGLSDLIWIYSISDRVDCRKLLPMKQIALTVITFGIYGIFWVYKTASAMTRAEIIAEKRMVPFCTALSVIFLRNISIVLLYRALENTNADSSSAEATL